jgi:hypothetical protein
MNLRSPLVVLAAASGLLLGQEEGGWRKFGENNGKPPGEGSAQAGPAPSQIVLPAGAWITVRVNETLSSDHNRAGDQFTATLAQPLVADGYVVARRGQTVAGRVTDAVKAGRIRGTSKLGLELTDIGLVDGRQLPVRTQLVQYSGGTSMGRDATAIGTTAGLGAAVGAVADGGFGAGMGAIAGGAASAVGVLLTRGNQTVVYPEATLTFRTESPLAISTETGRHAFQTVRQEDYEPRQVAQRTLHRRAYSPHYYYYDYFWPHYPYWYGPGWYGGSFFLYSRPIYYRGGHRGRR